MDSHLVSYKLRDAFWGTKFLMILLQQLIYNALCSWKWGAKNTFFNEIIFIMASNLISGVSNSDFFLLFPKFCEGPTKKISIKWERRPWPWPFGWQHIFFRFCSKNNGQRELILLTPLAAPKIIHEGRVPLLRLRFYEHQILNFPTSDVSFKILRHHTAGL